MEDAREQLRKARVLRLASDTGFVRRVLEGLRSQADSYGISAVVQLIDAIEARPQIDQADLDAIAEAFRQFLRANAAILGLGFERKSSPFSSQERLERLRPTAPMPGEAEPASTEPAPRDSKR